MGERPAGREAGWVPSAAAHLSLHPTTQHRPAVAGAGPLLPVPGLPLPLAARRRHSWPVINKDDPPRVAGRVRGSRVDALPTL